MSQIVRHAQELSKTVRFVGVAAMVVEQLQHRQWSRLDIICVSRFGTVKHGSGIPVAPTFNERVLVETRLR